MNTIKEKQFVVVSSNTSSFDYKLVVNHTIPYEFICVSSISIPKSYYALPTDAHITFILDSVSTQIDIPKGNYNPRSLKAVVQGLFPAAKIFYANPSTQTETNKYVITFSGVSQASIQADNIYLAHMLGIPAINTAVEGVQTGPDVIWTSPICLDYQSHNVILLKSDITKNSQSILQEVFSNGNIYNSAINWECNDLLINAKPIHRIDTDIYKFWLVDENNQLVDLNGGTFVFTLCLFTTSELDQKLLSYLKVRLMQATEG